MITMVINHLLSGMILQVYIESQYIVGGELHYCILYGNLRGAVLLMWATKCLTIDFAVKMILAKL